MILIGNIREVLTDELIQKCISASNKFNPRDRTQNEVLRDTIYGECVEVLFCNYQGLEQMPFEVIEYDAQSKNGTKYEIKHTRMNSKYWNFHNYDYFLSKSNNIDIIVLCYLDPGGDVFLKFTANSKSFRDYTSRSQFNSGYYYNVFNAKKDNQCIIH